MKSITADIGEKIVIKNTDGEEMGHFFFNPADPDIMRRCNIVSEKMEEIGEQIKVGKAEEIDNINKAIREQTSFLLGESASETLFKYNSPLSITPNGSIYALYIFDIILNFIEEEVKERTKKTQKTMEKYTAKYKKE